MSMITSGVWVYDDDEDDKVAITGYTGNETDIVIPSKIDSMDVVEIGEKAFLKKDIASIKFPDTLKRIRVEAFAGCDKLISVDLPDSLRYIGSSAFQNCSNLISLRIPDTRILLGENVFKGCCKLADEQGFVIVQNRLFDYYGNEKDVIIPECVNVIRDGAFANNENITSVKFPKGLKCIYHDAFLNCINLSDLDFQSNNYAVSVSGSFKNCPKLADKDGFVIVCNHILCDYIGDKSDVTIPEGVSIISDEAFLNNSRLVSVTFPHLLGSVHSYAFKNCTNLSVVRMSKTIPKFKEGAFDGCPNIVDNDGFIIIGNGAGNK